jgi:hypothetical protein
VREAVCGARGPDTAAAPPPHCPLVAGGETAALAGWVSVAPAAEAMPVGVVGPTEAPLLTEVEDDGTVAAGVPDGSVREAVGIVDAICGAGEGICGAGEGICGARSPDTAARPPPRCPPPWAEATDPKPTATANTHEPAATIAARRRAAPRTRASSGLLSRTVPPLVLSRGPLRKPLHSQINVSATRLTQRAPWLCVPLSREVCLFECCPDDINRTFQSDSMVGEHHASNATIQRPVCHQGHRTSCLRPSPRRHHCFLQGSRVRTGWSGRVACPFDVPPRNGSCHGGPLLRHGTRRVTLPARWDGTRTIRGHAPS